jgi:hypothetical protein
MRWSHGACHPEWSRSSVEESGLSLNRSEA